jgi:outer membrane phospholipase A
MQFCARSRIVRRVSARHRPTARRRPPFSRRGFATFAAAFHATFRATANSVWRRRLNAVAALAIGASSLCAAPARADDVTASGGEPFSLRDEQATTQPNVEGGLVEYFADRFSPHEPMYFIWGPQNPQIKFQVSLKYQIFTPDVGLDRALPWVSNLYIAYTQLSFWDIREPSGPFFDTSYKPELLWLYEDANPTWLRGMTRFDLHLGLQHESNGQAGPNSRSLNIAYVRPVFTFGHGGGEYGADKFFVTVAPRVWGYLYRLDENPDIADYRGYGDLRVIVGWRDGLQLSATGRVGNEWDKGSLELDLSYPLRRLTGGSVDLYAYAQYFTGYGESLIGYDESGESFRIGLALVR